MQLARARALQCACAVLGLAVGTGFCYPSSLALNRAHRNPPFRIWRAGCVPEVVARALSYRGLHLIIMKISIL